MTTEFKCPRCLEPHPLIECPYVKAIEFAVGDERLIRRVEFLTPADYGPAPKVGPEAEPAKSYPRLGEKG